MAAQANLKSTAITNLDASPIVRNTAGAKGPGRMFAITATAGPTTDAATTGGILRMCRIPSNCYVKEILVCQKAATTTATFDIGLYYSDAVSDGTQTALQGTAVSAQLFATNVDTHALVQWTTETFEAATYLPDAVDTPIWQAAALSTDPGGFFDVCLINTATISGAATMCMMVIYCP